ncbi:MAG TPA: ABC transporter ATP-binding protein [Candidatus Limnocylindrales bacterium]
MTAIGTDRAIEASGLTKRYRSGDGVIDVLRGVDLSVRRGAVVGITGRSGAGKTTLLNLLGGLDRPDGGSIVVDGVDLGSLGEGGLGRLRRETIAQVFQASSLVPILSAAENVEVPLRLRGTDPRTRDARVSEVLDGVGLGPRAAHRPEELSGGEQQRVMIARALAGRPAIVLADEPTAQLDLDTSRVIAALLRRAVDEDGITLVLTSHDPTLLAIADSVAELRDGLLIPA